MVELLVSLGMFSVIGAGFLMFVGSAAKTTAIENRASLASQELKNALKLLATEVKMSSVISPYLVGNTAATVTCSSAVAVTSTTLKFVVVQDEVAAATFGIQPYYVGYLYDSTSRRLLRGEIAGTTTTSCTLPAGDPTTTTYTQVLAENVVQIDGNGDGVVDPAFTTSGNSILINLGTSVTGGDGLQIIQNFPMTIYRRTA
jgi:hypothetical protein